MLLVRSINEYPEPITYKAHQSGLKMVKDLTVARRFIMQKLVVGMLNIVDQFHSDVSNGGPHSSFQNHCSCLSPFHFLSSMTFVQYMQALVETARDVMVWKEFAMEASRCNGYSDLGGMLLKLQNVNFSS